MDLLHHIHARDQSRILCGLELQVSWSCGNLVLEFLARTVFFFILVPLHAKLIQDMLLWTRVLPCQGVLDHFVGMLISLARSSLLTLLMTMLPTQ